MLRSLKWLADLKLAIVLLITIAFFSMIGSIIEQDKTIEYYQMNYPINHSILGFINYETILLFGFNKIFRSWWFFSLLLVFGSSLILCTFLQQLPSFDFSRSLNFLTKYDNKKNKYIFKEIKIDNFPQLISNIKKDNYFVFQNFNSFYAYKGIVGKLGPVLVHLSIILILVGSIVAASNGFTAQEIVPKSEIFYIQNTTDTGDFHFLPHSPVRVNDFWIRYSNSGQISQFFSNLSLLEKNGEEIKDLTISVNKPLVSNSIVWYQTDWDLIALRIKLENYYYQFPLTQISASGRKIWLSWVPLSSDFNQGVILVVDNLRGNMMQYNNFGIFDSFVEIGEKIKSGNSLEVFFCDIISSTGLQIKLDPGIFLIYAGFGFLICSTLLSYASYSRIWILKNKKNLIITGLTNRAKMQFEIQFLKFLEG